MINEIPYFLSNDGVTCQGGKMVSVNKGSWDKLSASMLAPIFSSSSIMFKTKITSFPLSLSIIFLLIYLSINSVVLKF